MKIFKQLAIIIGLSLAGDLLSRILHLPIPGSICGMLLLLILLVFGIVKEKDIKETADFMLQHMGFFFIPACVSIMGSYVLLRGQYIQIIILIVASTILVMSITALVVQFLGKHLNSKEDGNK
ncbi:MAG: CidA/LrgA family protein [Mangrovibacterium sp.]